LHNVRILSHAHKIYHTDVEQESAELLTRIAQPKFLAQVIDQLNVLILNV